MTGAAPALFHPYPFVWITVAAVRATSAPVASRRRTAVTVYGLRIVASAPPGCGPAVFYVGEVLYLSLSPYTLVGYLALAYLVSVTVLDGQRAAVSGARSGNLRRLHLTDRRVGARGVTGGGATIARSPGGAASRLPIP